MSVNWRSAILAKMRISPEDKRERNADAVVAVIREQLKNSEKEIGSAIIEAFQRMSAQVVQAMKDAAAKAEEEGADNFFTAGGFHVRPLLDKIFEILDANEPESEDQFKEYLEGKK